jgi:hypothetical protein
VLLSSHFERYVYAVNEEAIGFLNLKRIPGAVLSQDLRLLHSRQPIDELAATAWERRDTKLRDFVSHDAWIWTVSGPGNLVPARLLQWMTSPKPKSLRRYYAYWGIPDIFAAVTRTPHTRQRLWLGVEELVEKRNNIAHGDVAAQATQVDIQRYITSVQLFCTRADDRLGKVIGKLAGTATAW